MFWEQKHSNVWIHNVPKILPKESFEKMKASFWCFLRSSQQVVVRNFSRNNLPNSSYFLEPTQEKKKEKRRNKTKQVHVCGFTWVGVEREIYHLVLVRFRHGCSRNLHIIFLPYLRHITNRLGAERTCIPVQSPQINMKSSSNLKW